MLVTAVGLVLALGGCGSADEAVDRPAPRSIERQGAEVHINRLIDALTAQEWQAACEELDPEGLTNIVTGRRGVPAPRFTKCARALELVTKVDGVDFSGVGLITITKVTRDGDELVAQAENGGIWRLTPGPDFAVTAVPR